MTNYFVLILEYLLTRGKGVIPNILISTILSGFFYFTTLQTSLVIDMSKNAVGLLGILLGFTVSLFAIILSVNNEIVNKAKTQFLQIRFYRQNFSLYDQIVANIAFIICLFSFLLIYNFLFPIIFENTLKRYIIFFVLNIWAIIFSILELVSCIINYYLLVTGKNENSTQT
ncbi:hypothetical protein [Chryseobacterium aquaticum]|uniref:Uncharacterized protein n=1 Tax=Chryseobacterium aquaticum subsp. greenlandense TaxID=345663 RepID=A0A101CHN5_9FLAO|nr:hypothetical protein [Chryseobacterium aquaticum]KUJ56342.1 hypothetical protein AR686_07200 [Chryseobacterium aquaticum subsp. greenlandense]